MKVEEKRHSLNIIMGREKEGGRGTSLTETRILVHGFGCRCGGEFWLALELLCLCSTLLQNLHHLMSPLR